MDTSLKHLAFVKFSMKIAGRDFQKETCHRERKNAKKETVPKNKQNKSLFTLYASNTQKSWHKEKNEFFSVRSGVRSEFF